MERIVLKHLIGKANHARPCDQPHRSHGLPWSQAL